MDWPTAVEVDNWFRDSHLLGREALAPFMIRKQRHRSPLWPAPSPIIKSMKGAHPHTHCFYKMDGAGEHYSIWRRESAAWGIAFAIRQIPQAPRDLRHIWRRID